MGFIILAVIIAFVLLALFMDKIKKFARKASKFMIKVVAVLIIILIIYLCFLFPPLAIILLIIIVLASLASNSKEGD